MVVLYPQKKARHVDVYFGNSGGGTQLKSQPFRNFFDNLMERQFVHIPQLKKKTLEISRKRHI